MIDASSKKSQIDPVGDTGARYDAYYLGGYSARFDRDNPRNFIPDREFRLIISKVCQVILEKKAAGLDRKITILDFGCGDGFRFLPTMREIYNIVSEEGFELELIAYNISNKGVDKLQENYSRQLDFVLTDRCSRKSILTSKSCPSFKLVTIRGEEIDSIEFTKLQLGKTDISMAMYGVMGHIAGSINRQAVWQMINDVTDYSVVASVAAHGRMRQERLRHKALIAQGMPYQSAKEPGDLYYKRSLIDARGRDKLIEIFYHTFTISDLKDELAGAGLNSVSIGVASLFPPADLSFHPLLHRFDGWGSDVLTALGAKKVLPSGLLSQSSYLLCDWDKCEYKHASKVLGGLATSNSALITR